MKTHPPDKSGLNPFVVCRELCKRYPSRAAADLFIKAVMQGQRVFMSVYFLRLIVDALERKLQFRQVLLLFGGYLVFFLFYVLACQFYSERYQPNSNLRLRAELNLLLFEKSRKADLACFENPEYYDQYTKALSETEGRIEGIFDRASSLIASVAAWVIIGGSVWKMEPLAVLFALLPLASVFLIGKVMNQLQYQLKQETTPDERQKDYMKRAVYLPDYAKELRISHIFNVLTREFEGASKKLVSHYRRYGIKMASLDFCKSLFNTVIPYLCIWIYCSYRIFISKTLSIGQYTVIGVAVTNLAYLTMDIVQLLQRLHQDMLFLRHLQIFLDTPPTIDTGNAGKPFPPVGKRDIILQDVSFQYPGSNQNALEHINITIPEGSKTAIVGLNGAGKSTLIKLLLRLYDPGEGNITLGGVDIKNINVKSYRDHFSVFFQDFQIISASVCDNVFMGNQQANQKDCFKALELGMIDKKIASMPKQEQSILLREFNPDGIVPSLGECNKIALARMFAKGGEILILDEPSSSLDPVAEDHLFHHILTQFQDKTQIYITHRLTAASIADQIILLENGLVIEQGSHDALMARKGRYWDLFMKQKEAYQGKEGLS